MKRFIAASVLILCVFQTGRCQSFFKGLEFEPGGALILAYNSQAAKISSPLPSFFAELRYNFHDTPFDVGFHYSFGRLKRESPLSSGYRQEFDYRNFMVVSDYNFKHSGRISTFFGLGIGYSRQTSNYVAIRGDKPLSGDGLAPIDFRNSVCVMPRIGVEFFRIIRLTASYKIMGADYSCLEVALGISFGGWKE